MNTNAAAPRKNHHSIRQAPRPAALLVCLALLTGAACGQRGPLYLPAQGAATETVEPEMVEAKTVESETDEAENEDDEKEPRG